MHPTLIYDIQRLEHSQRLAEAEQRRTILQRLTGQRFTQTLAARGGRSAGRPSSLQEATASTTEFIRAS